MSAGAIVNPIMAKTAIKEMITQSLYIRLFLFFIFMNYILT